MASSFNAYGSTSKEFGGNKPVWLGTVAPKAIGGVLAPSACTKGAFYAAGTPVLLEGGVITPIKTAEDNFNGYLYNDINLGDLDNPQATGAVVMYHPEGLLADFTPAKDIADATLKAKVPGVDIVRFPAGSYAE